MVVAVAGWIQRDQQAAIVYLLEENRVLKARLRGMKLRFTDDERRRLAVKGIAGITPGPDSAFMMQVGRNLTDPVDGFLLDKRFLILDRDNKFTTDFRNLIEHSGTDVIRLPHRSPNLNAYAERFVLSIKSECLERMIFFGERSLRRAVTEFVCHYHGERNHQGLDNQLIEPDEAVGSRQSGLRCCERLGGLLKYYYREAA